MARVPCRVLGALRHRHPGPPDRGPGPGRRTRLPRAVPRQHNDPAGGRTHGTRSAAAGPGLAGDGRRQRGDPADRPDHRRTDRRRTSRRAPHPATRGDRGPDPSRKHDRAGARGLHPDRHPGPRGWNPHLTVHPGRHRHRPGRRLPGPARLDSWGPRRPVVIPAALPAHREHLSHPRLSAPRHRPGRAPPPERCGHCHPAG